MDRLGIGPNVGRRAVEDLEDILFRNVIDLATAVRKVQQKIEAITAGIQKSDQLHAGLSDIVIPEEATEGSEVIVRVHFSHEASISNVVDLK